MNLNKDPSSWARVHAESVPGWPAGVIISFVQLAIQDIATLAAEVERLKATVSGLREDLKEERRRGGQDWAQMASEV